jgi:hypothetical protein
MAVGQLPQTTDYAQYISVTESNMVMLLEKISVKYTALVHDGILTPVKYLAATLAAKTASIKQTISIKRHK